MGDRSPRQRTSGVRWASSPSCARPCDGVRSASAMLPTDFCFPMASTTSTRASSAPSFSSRLAPRPTVRGSRPGRGGWGTGRFTVARPASAGGGGFAPALSAESFRSTYLYRSCRARTAPRDCARSVGPFVRRGRLDGRSVKRRLPPRPGAASIDDPRAPARAPAVSSCGHVSFRFDPPGRASVARRASAFAGARHVEAHRPRALARSGEMACTRFHAPGTVRRLLQPDTYDARARAPSVRSSPQPAGGRFRPCRMRRPSLPAGTFRRTRRA